MFEGWYIEDGGIFSGRVIRGRRNPHVERDRGRIICQGFENIRDAELVIEAQDLLKAVISGDPEHVSWPLLIERVRAHLMEVSIP